jgi:hypothetical protein
MVHRRRGIGSFCGNRRRRLRSCGVGN